MLIRLYVVLVVITCVSLETKLCFFFPLAPAEGLVLQHCTLDHPHVRFSSENRFQRRREKDTNTSPERTLVSTAAEERAVADFRTQVIHPALTLGWHDHPSEAWVADWIAQAGRYALPQLLSSSSSRFNQFTAQVCQDTLAEAHETLVMKETQAREWMLHERSRWVMMMDCSRGQYSSSRPPPRPQQQQRVQDLFPRGFHRRLLQDLTRDETPSHESFYLLLHLAQAFERGQIPLDASEEELVQYIKNDTQLMIRFFTGSN